MFSALQQRALAGCCRHLSCAAAASSLKPRHRHGIMAAAAEKKRQAPAVVVGAGAGGIAVVGQLLDKMRAGADTGAESGAGAGHDRIVWVDPAFDGGRINRRYREVPSNTKVGLFLDYATFVPPLREIVDGAATPNAATRLDELPSDQTCSLHYAGDLLRLLSDGLVKHASVEARRGTATTADWDKDARTWHVTVSVSDADDSAADPQHHHHYYYNTPLLVYCTGASPTTVPLPASPPVLGLDTALKPSALSTTLPRDAATVVGVVGASHSAILVLMNLVRLATSTHPHLRVVWFARSPTLKYAVYKEGWILHDNTGLKGAAAAFARKELDGDALGSSEAGKCIRRVDCSGGAAKEQEAFTSELPKCDVVVQAVGYTPDALPRMNVDVEFDHDTGGFVERGSGSVVQGLFGSGIAFPERVVDRAGNTEHAVGFFKFMRFLERVVPTWVASARS